MMGMVKDLRLQEDGVITPLNGVTAHFQKPSDRQKADSNVKKRSTTSMVSAALWDMRTNKTIAAVKSTQQSTESDYPLLGT